MSEIRCHYSPEPVLLLLTGEHKLTYDKGTAEESFEWLALRDLADSVVREDPAWPLPPPPPQRSAPAHARQARVLNPAEAIAAALRAGHTPEALHRMVDEAVASLAAASVAHAAPGAAPAVPPAHAVHAAAHQPPAAAFHSQGSFMADLMDEDAEPANAAPPSVSADADARPAPAGPMGVAPVSAPPAASQHDEGGAAPLSMQLSMSELLGEDHGHPSAAPQADASAAHAQPASGQAVSQPQQPPLAPAVPGEASETPPFEPDGPQAVVCDATDGDGDGFGSTIQGTAQQRAADNDARLPDPLAVQDSGYEADIEAAVMAEPSGIHERDAMESPGVAGGQPGDSAEAPARPDGRAAVPQAWPPSKA